MSFNVLCYGKGEDFWENRREDLVFLIQRYDPDVIGMQEVTPEWYAYLKEKLSAYDVAGRARDGENQGEYAPIFYKKSKFTAEKEETFWLSETPDTVSFGWDAACRRICTDVILKSKRGKEFAAVNTHLDHVGPAAQKNGAAMIKEKMISLDLPAFCTGDFNVDEDSDVYKSMLDDKIGNAKYLAKMSEIAITFNDFGKHPENMPYAIDHCFVMKKKIKVLSYKVITDKRTNGRFISDHYPVFVTLDF